MENFVFISYSSKNNIKAKNFRKILETNGIDCWRAPESIEMGSDYAKAIPAAIKSCGLVVVLLSRCSQESQWVPKELDLAIKYKKPILPVYIESCDLIAPFDLYLSNVQAISMFSQKRDAIKNIVDYIRSVIHGADEESKEDALKKTEKTAKNTVSEVRAPAYPLDIAVIGVGSRGIRTVNKLINCNAKIGEYAVIDDSDLSLRVALTDVKIKVDTERLLSGVKACAEYSVAENADKIKKAVEKSKLVFIVSETDGGLGSFVVPELVKTVRESGRTVVAAQITSNVLHDKRSERNARLGSALTYETADAVLTFDGEDSEIVSAVKALSDLANENGLVNIDAEDILILLKNGGNAIFGSGVCNGEDRGIRAARLAFENSRLGKIGKKAKQALVYVESAKISLSETENLMKYLIDLMGKDVHFALGVGFKEELADNVRVSVTACEGKTAFPNGSTFEAETEDETPYEYPSTDLLEKTETQGFASDGSEEERVSAVLENIISRKTKTEVKTVLITRGNSVTRYELSLASGEKIRSVSALSDEIAYELESCGEVRVEAPIYGKCAVGVEVPNKRRTVVSLRDVLDDPAQKKSKYSFALGKDLSGNVETFDLAKYPHLLIAGRTGAGKSVLINCIVLNLIYKCSPDELKFAFVDTKSVEFGQYAYIPHLVDRGLAQDLNSAFNVFSRAANEIERRYWLFKNARCADIVSYNSFAEQNGFEKLPRIVVIVDELADLVMFDRLKTESYLIRLVQKSRAAGIHIIVATQRPSCDVLTGTLKANFSDRIALATVSNIDSRTVLDEAGAEALCGNGDMLFNSSQSNSLKRIQSPFVTREEAQKVADFVCGNQTER